MDEASQRQTGSRASACGSTPAFAAVPDAALDPIDARTPTLSIGFVVSAHTTVSWKIASDSTLRVVHQRIWLTRARSPYDYWLCPGDALRLARGERIWVSSDGPDAARVTITSAWSRRHTVALAWLEWFAGWPRALALRRSR